MTTSIQKRRLALFAFFFIPGLSMASWVTRTPAIRDSLGVSIAEMGAVLFGLSVGSMTGILSAGALVGRFGTRKVMFTGLCFIILSLATLALGVTIASSLTVALGLAFFGLGVGGAEIAVNMDGADVERITGKHLLHALHGFFSLGTVFGALIGIALNALHFPVALHMGVIALICIPVIATAIRHIPVSSVVHDGEGDHANGSAAQVPAWKEPVVLLIGFIVLAMALAEGAANDWLPLLMVDEYGFSPTAGSMVFLGFASAMTVGRFGGGVLLNRYGRAAVVAASAVTGAAGIAIVIFASHPALAAVAVVLWGLGASLGFPVALSAAGDSGPNGAARVKIVAIAGYVAFLVGPPLLGFVGEEYGLRNAMIVVLALVALATFCAPAIQRRGVAGKPVEV